MKRHRMNYEKSWMHFFVEFCRDGRVTRSCWERRWYYHLCALRKDKWKLWKVDCIGKTLAARRPIRRLNNNLSERCWGPKIRHVLGIERRSRYESFQRHSRSVFSPDWKSKKRKMEALKKTTGFLAQDYRWRLNWNSKKK